MKIFFAIIFMASISHALTSSFQSTVQYESKKPWFIMQGEETEVGGNRMVTISFNDGESNSALSNEEILSSADGTLISYKYKNSQLDQLTDAVMEKEGLSYSYGKLSDPKSLKFKKISLDEDEKKLLVVPSMLSHYIVNHWEQAVKGDVQLILFAPDRQDTFHFHFKLDTKNTSAKDIVLKANSFFVSIIASPIHFEFDDNKNLQRVIGIIPPVRYKEKDGSLSQKNTTIELVKPSEPSLSL